MSTIGQEINIASNLYFLPLNIIKRETINSRMQMMISINKTMTSIVAFGDNDRLEIIPYSLLVGTSWGLRFV